MIQGFVVVLILQKENLSDKKSCGLPAKRTCVVLEVR